MPVRHIYSFADPVLRQKARPVGRIDKATQRLIDDMIETMRAAVEEAKKNPDKEPEESNLGLNLLGGRASMVADWIDYNTLPPFERIAKYFYYSLLTASATPEGISFRLAMPTPPALK